MPDGRMRFNQKKSKRGPKRSAGKENGRGPSWNGARSGRTLRAEEYAGGAGKMVAARDALDYHRRCRWVLRRGRRRAFATNRRHVHRSFLHSRRVRPGPIAAIGPSQRDPIMSDAPSPAAIAEKQVEAFSERVQA